MDIVVVPAQFDHIKTLLSELNTLADDIKYRFGADKEDILLKGYESSLYKMAAVVDDNVIAVWGVIGNYLGEIGRPWSIMSPLTEKYPFRFKSFYSYELDKMLQLFPILVDVVDIRHTKVLRMLKLMRFSFGNPEKFMNGTFIRAERRL